MANEDETKKRLDAIQTQNDRIAKQFARLVDERDTLRDLIAHVESKISATIAENMAAVRKDMHQADMAIIQKLWVNEDRLEQIDKARSHGQHIATLYRVIMVSLLIVGILINAIVLAFLFGMFYHLLPAP